MAKKKVCKNCRHFVDGDECPYCKTSQFTTNWHGRITYIDAQKSMIAKKIGVTTTGEYAIKAN
ncbi:DNA-directed RNA polymerase subunit E'' [Candidatus Woesearchaeota archaeon]|nr:DNA-directed RNA polymerase subunit E'' [Candidatus Woesearchaeota archaeon]